MKRTLWIVAFLAVVGGFAGFQQYQSWSLNKKPQDDAAAKPQGGAERDGAAAAVARGRRQGRGQAGEAVPVLVATAVQKSVPVQLRAVGNVEAYNTVSVKSQVTGVLQKAHFKEGQDVKNGQLLFTIDPATFRSGAETSRSEPGARYRRSSEIPASS